MKNGEKIKGHLNSPKNIKKHILVTFGPVKNPETLSNMFFDDLFQLHTLPYLPREFSLSWIF
jgi:hypothetical protein